jgi:hypothetical protein
MKPKGVGLSVTLMAISLLVGWQYIEGLRTVQVLGLFASGALFGVSMVSLIISLKAMRNKA